LRLLTSQEHLTSWWRSARH